MLCLFWMHSRFLWKEQKQDVLRTIPRFIWVCNSDRVIWDVDHGCVFNFVDIVSANVRHYSALGDKNDVIPLKKAHKPCNAIKNTFSHICLRNISNLVNKKLWK